MEKKQVSTFNLIQESTFKIINFMIYFGFKQRRLRTF